MTNKALLGAVAGGLALAMARTAAAQIDPARGHALGPQYRRSDLDHRLRQPQLRLPVYDTLFALDEQLTVQLQRSTRTRSATTT